MPKKEKVLTWISGAEVKATADFVLRKEMA
jgi:hypothetical protein